MELNPKSINTKNRLTKAITFVKLPTDSRPKNEAMRSVVSRVEVLPSILTMNWKSVFRETARSSRPEKRDIK